MIVEATNALKTGDIAAGKKILASSIAVPNAIDLSAAKKLDLQIVNTTDPTHVQTVLMGLSDEAFQQLKQNGAMPPQLVTTFDALNSRAVELVKSQMEKVTEERELRLRAQLLAEAERKKHADAVRQKEAEAAAENARGAAETARKAEEEATRTAAEAARKIAEERDYDGLVLLLKTVAGRRGEYGGEITGEVINRRGQKLKYVQITFNLYDEGGAQVGTALANINGLEPGNRWKFKASTFGTDFAKYQFSELSGF